MILPLTLNILSLVRDSARLFNAFWRLSLATVVVSFGQAQVSCYDERKQELIQPERVKHLNTKERRRGRFVLYWMQAARRAEYNHALEDTIGKASLCQ